METQELRQLPGTLSVCPDCHGPIVWAKLMATPLNRGGKDMAFNPAEDPHGRVAVRPEQLGQNPTKLWARPLEADEEPDPFWEEILAMPHSSSCPAVSRPDRPPSFDGTNVTELAEWRRGR